jgi:hypothetical protein
MLSRDSIAAVILFVIATPLAAQQTDRDNRDAFGEISSQSRPTADWRGPLQDVSYQLLWLIESEDLNRKPYTGPARKGLAEAGFGRLVPAGSAQSSVTIGQESVVSGASRYGPMNASTTMLNTTDKDELQIAVDVHTKTRTPISIDTTVRVPLGRWFLLGSADSRVGLPLHEADGKRSVLIMRIDDGVPLLD